MTIIFDGNKPALTDAYTAFVTNLQTNLEGLGASLDPTYVTSSNVSTGVKRLNSANGLVEQWNGTAWAEWPSAYFKKAGDTFSGSPVLANNTSFKIKDLAGTAREVFKWKNTSGDIYFGDLANVVTGSIVHVAAQSSISFEVNTAQIALVNSTGMSVGGTRSYTANPSPGGEGLRIVNDGAYICGYNTAGTTRSGYLQFNPGAATLSCETGTVINFIVGGSTALTINSSGTVSGNGMIAGARLASGYDAGVVGGISCNQWFRSSGTTGWTNDTYGGGIYQLDSSWVRVYGSKGFHVDNVIRAQVDSATSYPSFILRNRASSASSHTYGALIWDAYRDVADPCYVGAITVDGQNPTGNTAVMAFRLNPNNSAGTMPVSVASLSSSGVFTAVDYSATSDERLKTDWEDLPDDFLEQLAAVKMGRYTMVNSNARKVGAGAQSLRPVMPEAVLEGEDGMLSITYGNAALTAAIALARKVVALQERLAKLEAQ